MGSYEIRLVASYIYTLYTWTYSILVDDVAITIICICLYEIR